MLLLGRRSAEEKLAWFLLMLDERDAAPNGDDIIRLPMCGVDIADYLGLAVETVSRILSQFKRRGVVRAAAPWALQLTNRDAPQDIVDGD